MLNRLKKISMQEIQWEKYLDRRYGLLAFVLLLTVFCIFKMLPESKPSFEKKLQCSLTQYHEQLNFLDQQAKNGSQRQFFVDTLDFRNGWQLIHGRLGEMRAWKNFKMTIRAEMEVMLPGKYRFTVSSDDGFRLKIGTNVVAEFLSNRAFAANTGEIYLQKGVYDLQIQYYQGYGQLGLTGKYQREGSAPLFIGQSGRAIRFRNY